jgi:hypothetical protein
MTATFRIFSHHSLIARAGVSLSSRWIISGLSTAFVAGFAVAQNQPAPAPAAASAAPIEASKVPDGEKLKVSSDSLGVMRVALKDVLQKLEEARNSKDVVKLTCVNEKLTQIKGLLRISEQSDVALQEAVARRETGTADHEFTKVTIARSKTDQLRVEAEQCMGQLAFRADENATIEVETPDYLPKNDISIVPTSSRTIDSRPPPASPTS